VLENEVRRKIFGSNSCGAVAECRLTNSKDVSDMERSPDLAR
jgi:hypothetical protein